MNEIFTLLYEEMKIANYTETIRMKYDDCCCDVHRSNAMKHSRWMIR